MALALISLWWGIEMLVGSHVSLLALCSMDELNTSKTFISRSWRKLTKLLRPSKFGMTNQAISCRIYTSTNSGIGDVIASKQPNEVHKKPLFTHFSSPKNFQALRHKRHNIRVEKKKRHNLENKIHIRLSKPIDLPGTSDGKHDSDEGAVSTFCVCSSVSQLYHSRTED